MSGPSREGKLIVRLRQEVRPLIDKYLVHLQADIRQLQPALEKRDFKTLREITHRIIGCSAMYGTDVLAEICVSLNRAAKAEDRSEIQKGIKELSETLPKLEFTYE